MKAAIKFFFLFLILTSFMGSPEKYRHIRQESIRPGEQIQYRIHYGFINAGEAIMHTDEKIHVFNNRPCYKLDIFGRTTGFFDLVLRIRDNWGSYLDTGAIVSQRFYQTIEEGGYRKKEIIDFNQEENIAIAHRLDKNTGALKSKVQFPVPDNIQDIVSGYYYMRTFNYDTLDPDDIFQVTGFFDDTTYHVKVHFLGREKINTKLGEFDALVMSPIMPKNQMFRGDNPIKAWLSDDKLRIPLKIKAEMLVGSVEFDIKDYKRGDK